MRVIKITTENDEFVERVEDLSGQPISLCFQCGECSSSCPVASATLAISISRGHLAKHIKQEEQSQIVLESKSSFL